jgi:hypothetical protein
MYACPVIYNQINESDGAKHVLVRGEDVMLVYKDAHTRDIKSIKPAFDRLLLEVNKDHDSSTTSGGILIPKASESGDVVQGKVTEN